MPEKDLYPAALTIAGSDSGGGAGIQADLRTFSAFGVFGCSAITALTAQNPFQVTGISPVSPEFVQKQIRAVLGKFSIRGVKTGMLFSAEIIRTVAEELKKFPVPLVLDPVMISTSGTRLLEEDAIQSVLDDLLPLAAWVTPNLFEAEILAGVRIRTLGDMEKAAELCLKKFGCGIIIKGGHGDAGQDAIDVVRSESLNFHLTSPRLELPPLTSHGTGCTFSAAITANLAKGLPPEEALTEAKKFVYQSLGSYIRTGNEVFSMYPEKFQIGR